MSSCPTVGEIFVQVESGHVTQYVTHEFAAKDPYLQACKAWSYLAKCPKGRLVGANDNEISSSPWIDESSSWELESDEHQTSIVVQSSSGKNAKLTIEGDDHQEVATQVSMIREMYDLLLRIYNDPEVQHAHILTDIFELSQKIETSIPESLDA